jgi:uncharacterized protein (TIGR03435 family)
MANRFAREMTWTVRTAVAAVLAMTAHAQRQPAARAEFEVVSVKPADPAANGNSWGATPGRFQARNFTLKGLLLTAYHLNEYQLEGGPKWMDSAGFNIDAKLPAGAPMDQAPLMIQAMLADRFKLEFHHETKTRPEYALVIAKGGPKLQAAHEDDRDHTGSATFAHRLQIGCVGPISGLADMLISAIGAPVLDRTNLKGRYKVTLTFAPLADDPAPTVFAALQEQLGLRLEAIKGPVDVLVIDRVEMPTEN